MIVVDTSPLVLVALYAVVPDPFTTASNTDVPDDGDAVALFETGIRALVRAVSRLAELDRIMAHEAVLDSERLAWLVDRHVRARFEQLSDLWRQVQAGGHTHLDADPVFDGLGRRRPMPTAT